MRQSEKDEQGREFAKAGGLRDVYDDASKLKRIQPGLHIGEFHNPKELAREKAYEFCYVARTNKIKGATAGFSMRPIAIR